MRVVEVVLLLIGYISYTSAQDVIYVVDENTVNATFWPEFDCRRPPGDCANNGFCDDGVCDCNAGFAGINCDVNIGNGGGPTGCTIPCDVDHGSCYMNNLGVQVCSCDSGFVGADCSIVRVSVDCRADDMLITIYPQPSGIAGVDGEFKGRYGALAVGSSTIAPQGDCGSNTVNPTRWLNKERFETTFRPVLQNNPCGAYLTTLPAALVGGNKVCYDILLQYNVERESGFDEKFKFCCEDLANTGNNVAVGNNRGGGAVVDGTISIITSRLEYTDNRTAITSGSNVGLGAKISFVVSIDPAVTKYDDFRVVQCYANPGNILIVDNQCPNPKEKSVVTGIRRLPVVGGPDEILVDIYAYRGTSNNVVTLSCDCLVCSLSSPCPPKAPCPSYRNQDNEGRKKRQADTTDSPLEMFTTSATFIVVDPSQVSLPGTTPVTVQTPCYQSTIFIAIATVFGVLLLVALVVSVFLCMRYAASDRRGSSEPTAYFNSGMTKA